MGTGQGGAAQPPEQTHPLRRQVLGHHDALPVAQLADVEVPAAAVDTGGALPAEEDVAGGLHQPLPGDDPLALGAEPGGPCVGREHRLVGLLGLEEQRVLVVLAEQQHDPAAGADTADTDDLAGDVGEPEALQQEPAVGREGLAVALDEPADLLLQDVPFGPRQQILQRDQQRRVGGDPPVPVDDVRELFEHLERVPRLGTRPRPVPHLKVLAADLGGELLRQLVRLEARVPDLEVAIPA